MGGFSEEGWAPDRESKDLMVIVSFRGSRELGVIVRAWEFENGIKSPLVPHAIVNQEKHDPPNS